METNEKSLLQYRKDIKLMLPIYGKKEKQYLDKLFNGIEDYIEDHPNVTSKQIIDKFGSPKDVAGSYIMSVDQDYLLKNLRKNAIIKKGICLIAMILIIFCVSVLSIMYRTYQSLEENSPEHIETTIEYIDPEDFWENYQETEINQ